MFYDFFFWIPVGDVWMQEQAYLSDVLIRAYNSVLPGDDSGCLTAL